MHSLHSLARPLKHCRIGIPFPAPALILFLAPLSAGAQCQPLAGPVKPQTYASQSSSQTGPQFFDEPKFTVAGVTDTSNPAGHGTSAVWRTTETLVRETAALSKSGSSAATPPNASASATEKSLREAVQENENFEANHSLGKLLLNDGEARDAIPYLEQASRLNPGDYATAYELALAYANAGNYEQARDHARELLARRDTAELHHLLADVEEKLKHPLEAVREYQRAAELTPSESNLFDWGAELLLHHAPEPAGEVFSKGAHLFPDSTRMLIGLGTAWYSRGSYERAAQCLCEASDLHPNDADPYLFLGKMQTLGIASSEGIVQRLARFAQLQPENAMASYYYAVSLWKQRTEPGNSQNAKQAESLLQNAVRLDPNLGLAYLQLGVLYSERNELPMAISAYEKAAHADPDLGEAHYRLAQAYRLTGEKLKAEREIQLYEQASKATQDTAERERHDLQQFVYTLRDQPPLAQPQ